MSFASFLSFWAVAANELIFGSARPAEAQSVEPEDALQMSEQHLDLLSFATGDGVGLGLCSRAGLVASGFVNGARDLARRNVRAAFWLERAGLAVVLAREAGELGSLREIVNPSRRVSPNSAGSPRPRIEILDAGGSRG